jgi:hypothetical protein
MHPRLKREEKTIDLMIYLYCQGNHGTKGRLCEACLELKEYAHLRLEKCPYQEQKTTCANCLTHCYKQSMRDQVRTVMRYVGPRMLFKHPWLAIMHMLDGLRKPVPLEEIKQKKKAEHHS